MGSSGLGQKQVAGSCEGGNEMLSPKNKAVNFFAICDTASQEGLGSGEVKLKLLHVAIYLPVSCGQPSHLSDSTSICLPSTFSDVCHVKVRSRKTRLICKKCKR